MGTKNSVHASVALFYDFLIIFKTEKTEFLLGDGQEFGGSMFVTFLGFL